MAGHKRVLEVSDEEFLRGAQLIETSFRRLAAAFFFDSATRVNSIDIFDFFEEVDEVEDWIQLRSFAADVQQMVLYAFEGAPDSIVSAWAEGHVGGSGELAIQRVKLLRRMLPSARRQWEARFTDLARTLGDVKTTHVFDEDLKEHKTVIRLDSFFAQGVRHVPLSSSREYITAALTRNELRRVIDRLRMADFRYEDSDDVEILADDAEEEDV